MTQHRYILRFTDYATGWRRSYSCATKDKFSNLQMYLAWIRLAPIIERHRDLPPGQLDAEYFVPTAIPIWLPWWETDERTLMKSQ